MLALAEYVVLKTQLEQLGKKYDELIYQQTKDLTKQQALKVAQSMVPRYMAEYRSLLDDGMFEVASTATAHYVNELDEDWSQEDAYNVPWDLAQQQWDEKYYGMTLNQRLGISEKVLRRRMVGLATLNSLHKAFIPTVPYGSQTAFDRRLMLGMFSKIENDAAKDAAERNNIDFIRWTLSHRHAKPDECDDLANAVDKAVVAHLEELKLDADPKGLYFRDQLPPPPHPNCQCEYQLVSPGVRTTRTRVRRAVQKVRSLINRLRGK